MARHEDRTLLEAAILGYKAELNRITSAIADIHKQLGTRNWRAKGSGGEGGETPTPSKQVRKKRHKISAEGRARIAEAQRKRWAAAKKRK
jgi:hypothetical protein